jgi:pimeloyl-ACP methyl ester carboxylesterase
MWESSAFRSWVSELARTRTVIRYDRPGTGLSQPFAPEPDAEQEAGLSATLLDALGLGPAAVLGASCGGCSSIVLAATRPDLVSHLVLYGAYADGSEITTREVQDSLAALVRAHWGLGSQTLADVFMPDADTRERDEFARFQRRVEPAEVAARQLELVYRWASATPRSQASSS